MKTFNFNLLPSCSGLRRTGQVSAKSNSIWRHVASIILLLCLGIGQMWGGTKKIYLDTNGTGWNAASATIWVHAWDDGGSWDYQMSLYSGDIYVATINDAYTNCQFVRNNSTATAISWSGDGFWGKTGSLEIGDNNRYVLSDYKDAYSNGWWSTIMEVKGGTIYFDNSLMNWAPSNNIQFFHGDNDHDYTYVDNMTNITNTLLWYKDLSAGNSAATYLRFADDSYASGAFTSSSVPSVSTNIYTSAYEFNSSSLYLFTTSSGDNGAGITPTYQSAYTNLNCSITIATKVSTDCGSSYSDNNAVGALSVSSYKFSNYNTCSTSTSGSLSVGSASRTIVAGYTAATTLTATRNVSGYYFAGWYDASGNLISGNTSVVVRPKTATTYYAYYTTCPSNTTAGTAYKFQFKTTLSNTTSLASFDLTEFTSADYVAGDGVIGGRLYGYNNTSKLQIVDGRSFALSDGSKSYFKLELECPIKEGDVIKYIIYNQNARLYSSTSKSDATLLATLTKTADYSTYGEYIVPSGSGLIDKTTLYLFNGSNGARVHYFEIIRKLKITLDENGGSALPDIYGDSGDKVVLPHTFKADNRFKGWFTATTGGTQRANYYTISGGETVHAQWEDIPASGDMFTLRMESSMAPASNTTIAKGDSVDLLKYATIYGGEAVIKNGGSNAKGIIAASTSKLTLDDSNLRLRIALDFPILEGDTIITNIETQKLSYTNSTSRSTTNQFNTGSNEKIVVNSSSVLKNKSVFYIWSGSTSSGVLSSLKIKRPAKYTITYDKGSADGASGSLAAGTKIHNANYTISSTDDAFTRSGFTYDGWSTSEDGSTKDYDFNETYSTNADLTLYPHWVADASTYSITYHCNSATSGCPSNATEQTALPDPLPTGITKNGYTFGGWYTDEDCTVAAGAGDDLSADADLYAKWIPLYTITPAAKYTNDGDDYTSGTTGGTLTINSESSAQSVASGSSYTITATPASGYCLESLTVGETSLFAQASGNSRQTAAYSPSSQTASGNVTVTAKFAKLKTISVYVYTGDKEGWVPQNIYCYVGQTSIGDSASVGFTDTHSKWKYYTIHNVTKLQSSIAYSGAAHIQSTTITGTIYYDWDKTVLSGLEDKASVTYSDQTYVVGASAITLSPTYTNFGSSCTYAWSVTSEPDGGEYTFSSTTAASPTFSATVAGTYTLKVVCTDGDGCSKNCSFDVEVTAPSFTVTYKANNGTEQEDVVDDDESSFADNPSFTAPATKAFAGWNTKADGTGTHYDVGDVVESDITVYADWKYKVYYIASSTSESNDITTALASKYKVDVKATTGTSFSASDYSDYALIVLSESLTGSDAATTDHELKKIVGVDKPILNLKSYFYNSGRWGWGTPNAGKTPLKIYVKNDTYSNLTSHPIYTNLTPDASDSIQILSSYDTGDHKPIQPVGSFESGCAGYSLALVPNSSSGSGTAIHELTAEQRSTITSQDISSKYLLISIYSKDLSHLSDGGKTLIKNAADYLITGEQWVPCYAFTVSRSGTENNNVQLGKDAGTLTCTTSVVQSYSYQWKQYTSGQGAGDAVNAVGTGATSGSFSPSPASTGTYYYFCEVTNSCGTTVTSSTTGTFVFTDPVYNVTYKKNGNGLGDDGSVTGSVPSDATNYASGDSAVIMGPNSLALTDYTFIGWNDKADGTGTYVSPGARVKLTSDKTFYAIWRDASGTSCPDGTSEGTVFALSMKTNTNSKSLGLGESILFGSTYATTLTNGDAAFTDVAARSTQRDQTKAEISKGSGKRDSICFEGNDAMLTLYLDCALAEGDVISFTGTNSVELSFTTTPVYGNSIATSSKSYTIPESSPLIDKHIIYVWRASTSTQYVTALTITRPEAETCSAPTSATISGGGTKLQYNAIELSASATGTINGTTTYTWYRGNDGEDSAIAAGAIQAESTSGNTYTIAECSTTDAAVYYCVISNGTGCKVTASTSVSVTARYVLTYSANTDDPSVDNIPGTELHTPSIITLSSTVPTRTGYDFAGWYYYSNYSGTKYDAGGSFTTGALNETLYAKWTAQSYTITYKDQGNETYSGSNGGSLPTSHTYGSATDFVDGEKSGYRFLGWYTDASCTISAGSSIGATAITANTTYYAKWAQLYTITTGTHANGAIAITNSSSEVITEAIEGETVSIAATAGVHYGFGTWSLYKTGDESTTVSPAAATASTTFTMPAYGVTVNATFTKDAFTLSYDDGGATNGSAPTNPAAGDYAYGTVITVPDNNTLAKSSDAFVGWLYNDKVLYTTGQEFTMTENVTLTAVWNSECVGGGGTSVYKFHTKTGMAPSATININKSVTSVTTSDGDVTATSGNYLSELSGGTLGMNLSSNGDIRIATDSCLYYNNSSAYMQPTLSTATIQRGDIIKYRISGNAIDVRTSASAYSANTDVTLLTGGKAALATNSMHSLSSVYLYRNSSSAAYITYFEIYRPSEVLFYAEAATGMTAGNVSATETQRTTSDYLTHISGGSLYTGGNSDGDVKITENELQLKNNNGYIKIALSKALAEGDIIIFNSSNNYQPGITLTKSRSITISTTNKMYTIPKDNSLIGESTIYLWRGTGDTNIRTIAIVRPGNSSECKFDVSFANENGFAGGATVTLPSDIEGVPAGMKIAKPADPTTTGDYVFGGWFTDDACTEAWDFASDKVTEDVTLYAKWYDADYTITWKANGETYATTKACDAVTTITLPTAPADDLLDGCANSFRGWSATNLYGEANDDQPADLFIDAAGAPTIDADKTFYAVFGTATDAAYLGTVLWSEDWTGESNGATPSGITTGGGYAYPGSVIKYTWVDGTGLSAGASKVTNDNNSLESKPDAFIGKKGSGDGATGGSLIISGIPTGGAAKVTLSYTQNANQLYVYLSGTDYSFSGGGTSVNSNTAGTKEHTIICGTDETFTLTFTATTTSNVRLDDIVVKIKEDGATDYRCICPSLTLAGPSADLVFVTSTAEKTVRSQEAFTVSGTGLTKSTALTAGNFGNSKFAFKTATGGTVSTDANGDLEETSVYVFYTPDAEDDEDGLDEATEITISIEGAGEATSDDLYGTKRVIGRHLPANFVIAAKNGDKWYAMPATMSTGTTPTPVEIAVDDIDNPSVAYTDDDNYYGLAGPTNSNISGGNGQYIRLTMHPLTDGTGSAGPAPLYASTTSNIGKNGTAGATSDLSAGWWWLLTQTNTSITNPEDAKYTIASPNNGNPLKLYKTNNVWGLYSYTGTTISELRLIPAQSGVGFAEAEIVAWGKNSVIVEVDNSTMIAHYVKAKLPEDVESEMITLSQTRTSVKGTGTRYNYTVDFGEYVDFSANDGKMLTLEWYDILDNFKAVTNIIVPCIVAEDITINKSNYSSKSVWNKEVHVLPGTTVTVDASAYSNSDVTIKELVIYPGAKVVAEKGTLKATTLVLRNGWNRLTAETEYNVAQLYIPTTGSLQATNAYADWYIDYDQYYPIAVPWKVATANIAYRNTSGAASAGVMIRYYDGERRAKGGAGNTNWKQYEWGVDMPTYLEPGIGYAITARRPAGKAFSIVRLPLSIPSTAWTTAGEQGNVTVEAVTTHKDEVTVTAWQKDDGTTPKYAKGWNFVANPYMSSYEGEITFAPTSDPGVEYEDEIAYVNIPDVNFKEFDQVAAATAELKPGCGFLIQTEYDGKITFGTSHRVDPSAAPAYRKEAPSTPKQKAYILLSGNEAVDQMGLIIADRYTADYEVNADLEKLLSDGNTLRTYLQYNNMNLAYVAINSMLAQEWIPVSVRIPAAGEYTYSIHRASRVGELEGLYLIDYTTNVVTNLLESDYVFTATAGTITDRFALNAIYGPRETPTDIDVVQGGGDLESNQPVKFMFNNKIYIYYQGVIYDTTGKKVAERRAAL